MEELKTSPVTLKIELNVDCPHCEECFDLLEECSVDDEADIFGMALPDGIWHTAHKKFEFEFECPECKKTFLAKTIEW